MAWEATRSGHLSPSLPDPVSHHNPVKLRKRSCVCVWCVQVFSYTANKEIRTDDLCLDVSKLNGPVMMLKCHHLKGNQLWEYDPLVSVWSRLQKYPYSQMTNTQKHKAIMRAQTYRSFISMQVIAISVLIRSLRDLGHL